MNKKEISFVYFGTPEFSVIVLNELKKVGYVPSLVITAPDRPVGRKHIITPPPAKVWAEQNDIPFLQPNHPRDIILNLKERDDDLYIIASYGYIVSQELLDIPQYGVLNVHTSLLPKYRGASPIESAILNGDTETGSTIMKMTLGMDEGPILNQSLISIDEHITKPELFNILAHDGGQLLTETIDPWIEGKISEQEQEHKLASYCTKIKKIDGDITNDDHTTRYRKYRAYFGWPGVFILENGKRLKITQAHFENGKFMIKKIIPEGKNEMDYSDYLKNKK